VKMEEEGDLERAKPRRVEELYSGGIGRFLLTSHCNNATLIPKQPTMKATKPSRDRNTWEPADTRRVPVGDFYASKEMDLVRAMGPPAGQSSMCPSIPWLISTPTPHASHHTIANPR
jgi:hypothetical protein